MVKIENRELKVKIVFITHSFRQCGVYQYGRSIFDDVSGIDGIQLSYRECSSKEDILRAVSSEIPDIVFYNFHYGTIPFSLDAMVQIKKDYPKIVHLGFAHEMIDSEMDLFDFAVCSDPTLKETDRLFKTGRVIPRYDNKFNLPLIPTFGSFGFCCPHKGYERLIDLVQEQFDEAVIRINLAFQTPSDTAGDGARQRAESCRRRISKPNVRLEITYDFFANQTELMDFLAKNSLNAFLYEDEIRLKRKIEDTPKGISSVIDFAMAVRRPVAISSSNMFRHLLEISPSIVVGKIGLRQIMENGLAPLSKLYEEWTLERLRESYTSIFCRVLQASPRRFG